MKILVACEESQILTNQLRLNGHEAYSCDIQDTSGQHPEWHIKDDVLNVINKNWDMIIAFPPCTYLSNAGACRLYLSKGIIDYDRYKKGLKAKELFLKIYNSNCPKIAIENPISSKIYQLPKYSQEIQPFYFGHPYTKRTRLWLKGLPELIPTNYVEPIGPYVPSCTSRKIKDKYGAAKRGDDSKNRSKTFEGIAKAMAIQWT